MKIKKNLIIFFYLLAVIGLGTGSLLVGQRISDTQKKVTPQKAEAGEPAGCLRCCWDEVGGYGTRWQCSGCAIRKPKDCKDDAEDCWAPQCISCTNLATNTNDFQKGQTYTFHCSGKNISWVTRIDRYIYRYKVDNGGWTEKTSQLSKAQLGLQTDPIGFQLKTETAGQYTIQCRACTTMGCSEWMAL